MGLLICTFPSRYVNAIFYLNVLLFILVWLVGNKGSFPTEAQVNTTMIVFAVFNFLLVMFLLQNVKNFDSTKSDKRFFIDYKIITVIIIVLIGTSLITAGFYFVKRLKYNPGLLYRKGFISWNDYSKTNSSLVNVEWNELKTLNEGKTIASDGVISITTYTLLKGSIQHEGENINNLGLYIILKDNEKEYMIPSFVEKSPDHGKLAGDAYYYWVCSIRPHIAHKGCYDLLIRLVNYKTKTYSEYSPMKRVCF